MIHITNEKLIQFYLKYGIDYEKILINIVDSYLDIIEDKNIGIDLNLLLSEHTKLLLKTNVFKKEESLISNIKGKEKEDDYYKLLVDNLEYEIINTSMSVYNMDILIKINEMLNIRIDIKNYSNNIPLKEITKFHNDIKITRSHGILISDKTNISNKKNFTFDILENKYIAFYISKNEMNIDVIKKALNIIINIDKILNKNDVKILDRTVLNKLNKILIDYSISITQIKENMNTTLHLINKVSIENLCNLLDMTLINEEIKEKFKCDISECNKEFDTDRKLKNHIKKDH
jgi:hypothetical protein